MSSPNTSKIGLAYSEDRDRGQPIHRPEPAYRNELLRRMSPADLQLLSPHLHSSFLPLRTQLETANAPIEAVYFFETGIGSVVAKLRPEVDAEVVVIGFEGMTGSALVMGGDRSQHDCYIQVEAGVLSMHAEPFTKALSDSPTLRLFLLRYVHYAHIQTCYTALANARLKLEERLARWLIMCDDRTEADRLPVTHEFLSVMLGVRRPGVTVALQLLEGRGLIRSNRGEVIVRDRAGLIILANGSYGQPEAEYARLIGEPASP